MSRLSRREIKRDELVTGLEKLTFAAEQHARSLVIAAAAAILLIAAVSAGIWYSRSRAADAAVQLASLQAAVDAPVAVGAATSSGALVFATAQARNEEILRRAETLLESHPSSRAGRWAAYWKAVSLRELGRHDEALAALAPLAASQDEPFLTASARMQQGKVHEAKGDLAAAAAEYAAIASSTAAEFPVEMAMMSQARLLEAQGKKDEAQALYRRVSEEYPESPYAGEAARRR